MQDLINELGERSARLDAALRTLSTRGKEYAQAEQKYRTALAQEILIERDKGTPVTIINDVCRGKASIAKLRMERDIAETMYKSASETINVYKIQLRIVENQIDREWHSGG